MARFAVRFAARSLICVALISIFAQGLRAEDLRASISGVLKLSESAVEGSSVWLRPGNSVLIHIDGDSRFFTGMEIRISAPNTWFAHQGSLDLAVFADLSPEPKEGINELVGRRVASELLPGRVQTVYQIPMRQIHGLRTGPYSTVPSDVVMPKSFPVVLTLSQRDEEMSDELAEMSFLVSARPILSDEGAVRVVIHYPEQLKGLPFTVLINDVVVENLSAERILKEGEHHLSVVSQDYRNESRRFVVERSRTVDLVIELQDPTPLIIFDAPLGTQIFLNNVPVPKSREPISVEPGTHEARFHVGDHTLTRVITVQRGRTYRVSLTMDVDIDESE